MKKIIGLLIVGILVGIATISFVRSNLDEETDAFEGEQMGTDLATNPANEGLGKGDTAPDFTLTTLSGEEVTLSDYRGKHVILNFWATWCPPCKAEMPHMQNYYEDVAPDSNVEILAVNLTDRDVDIENIKSFVDDFALSFPIPLDEEGEVGDLYKAITIPTSYIINSDGIIQHKIVGPMDEQMMTDYINNLN